MSLLGELLVKLGVDSSDYVKDMGEAKNTANTFGKDVTKSMDNVAKETKNSSFSWTELNSAIAIGGRVIDIAKKAYDAIVTPTIEYAAQVRNLARVSGESAEKTSRLIQVADDMTVSYESLMTAARMAAQKGIALSTESLAKLSDEYLKLKPGAERATFLIDTFGRSGLEMGKLLDKGSDAIRKMSSSIDDSLIMTQKGIDEARIYEIAVDNLGDSWAGFTMTLGKTVIPRLSEFITNMNLGLGAITGNTGAIDDLNARYRDWQAANPAATAGEMAAAYRDLKMPIDDVATAIDNTGESAKIAEEAIKEQARVLTDMYTTQLGLMSGLQSADDKYAENYKKLTDERNTLDQERIAEVAKGADASVEAIQKIDTAIYDNTKAIQDNAIEHDKATQKIKYNLLEELLLADGKLTLTEMQGLTDKGVAWGIYSQTVVDEAKRAYDEVNKIAISIDNIPSSKSVDIGVNYYVRKPDYPFGYASGGHISAGETAVVGERGPELFRSDTGGTIIPNSQATPGAGLASGRSGGSTINLNVNVNGAIGDPQETGRQMVPALRYALRELGFTGG